MPAKRQRNLSMDRDILLNTKKGIQASSYCLTITYIYKKKNRPDVFPRCMYRVPGHECGPRGGRPVKLCLVTVQVPDHASQ